MAITLGNRCTTISGSVSGTLASIGRNTATIRRDDGRLVNVPVANLRRPKRASPPKPVEDVSQYSERVQQLAKANGVSCRQCAEWLREPA